MPKTSLAQPPCTRNSLRQLSSKDGKTAWPITSGSCRETRQLQLTRSSLLVNLTFHAQLKSRMFHKKRCLKSAHMEGNRALVNKMISLVSDLLH